MNRAVKKLHFERLEHRRLLAEVTWTGGDGSWNTAANWTLPDPDDPSKVLHEVPQASDDVVLKPANIQLDKNRDAKGICFSAGGGVAPQLDLDANWLTVGFAPPPPGGIPGGFVSVADAAWHIVNGHLSGAAFFEIASGLNVGEGCDAPAEGHSQLTLGDGVNDYTSLTVEVGKPGVAGGFLDIGVETDAAVEVLSDARLIVFTNSKKIPLLGVKVGGDYPGSLQVNGGRVETDGLLIVGGEGSSIPFPPIPFNVTPTRSHIVLNDGNIKATEVWIGVDGLADVDVAKGTLEVTDRFYLKNDVPGASIVRVKFGATLTSDRFLVGEINAGANPQGIAAVANFGDITTQGGTIESGGKVLLMPRSKWEGDKNGAMDNTADLDVNPGGTFTEKRGSARNFNRVNVFRAPAPAPAPKNKLTGKIIGAGDFEVADAVVNEGVVQIGDATDGESNELELFNLEPEPIGTIFVRGNYVQSDTGELLVDLAGNAAGIEYDQLRISDNEAVGGEATIDGALDVMLINGFDVENPSAPTGQGLKTWRLGGPTSASDRDMFSVLTATGVLDGEFFDLKQREQIANDEEDVSPVPDVEARYEWRIVYDTDNQYNSDLANKYPIFDSGTPQDATNQPWISDAEELKEVVLVLEDTLIAHYKLDDPYFYGPQMERIKDTAWEDHHADFDNYGVGTEWVTQAKHDGGLKFTPRTGYQDQAKIESPDRDDEDPPKPGLDIGYGDFAATAWFKADTSSDYDSGIPPGVVRLVEKVSGESSAKIGYSMRVEDNKLVADIWDGAGGKKSLSVSIPDEEAGGWNVAESFSLAANGTGERVILWETQAFIDNSNEIRGQRMAADGSLGNDFFVAYSFDGLRHPSVALDDYGRFGAAWEVLDENGQSVGIDAVTPSSLELQKEQLIGGRSGCGRSAMHAHLALWA